MALTSASASDLNIEYQWFRTLSTDVGTANIGRIVNAPEGDYYIAGYYGAKAGQNLPANEVLWSDTDIAPEGGFTYNYQNCGMVARMNATGDLMWKVLPSLANFSANSLNLATTPDGGVVLAANATFNKSGANAPTLIELTDTKGTKVTIEWTGTPEGTAPYTGVLIKFSAEGAMEWHRLVNADTEFEGLAVTSPITLNGVVADAEGNIYIAGTYLTKFDLGDGVAAPQALNTVVTNGKVGANGDAFVAKFAADGTPVKVLTNGGDARYATMETVSAITEANGKLYCAVLVNGAEGCDYTLFGHSAEVAPGINNGLTYAEIDGATLECTRAAGASAAYTDVTTSGHVLQIKGAQVAGSGLYICGGLNGALEQNGTTLAASTAKQIQTLTLGIDLTTFQVKAAYECGAGIGNDFYAIVDEGAGSVYTYGYSMTGGNPVSLRHYDLATGELKADNVLFKGGSILTGLFNNSTKQFLATNYAKSTTEMTGSDEAFPSFSSFSGYLFSFSLPDINATSGIEAAAATAGDDADAPVEYFNLQGMRISRPEAGTLVIRRAGETVEKVIF